MSIVKGRVGVVLPDNVLTDTGTTAKVRERLLRNFNLHTILRLPTGIFYANGIKTNVLFFDKGEPTEGIWVYDNRTGVKHTLSTKPMKREHLQEFVDCYCTGNIENRKSTYSEKNPNGRWRYFSAEEVKKAENLDFVWINLDERDERSSNEILTDLLKETKAMDKGTGQTCAYSLPLWADGGILLVPVPLPAYFIVRQPISAAPCGHGRILCSDRSSLSFSQAYVSGSVSSC